MKKVLLFCIVFLLLFGLIYAFESYHNMNPNVPGLQARKQGYWLNTTFDRELKNLSIEPQDEADHAYVSYKSNDSIHCTSTTKVGDTITFASGCYLYASEIYIIVVDLGGPIGDRIDYFAATYPIINDAEVTWLGRCYGGTAVSCDTGTVSGYSFLGIGIESISPPPPAFTFDDIFVNNNSVYFTSDDGQACGWNNSVFNRSLCGPTNDITPTFNYTTQGDSDCKIYNGTDFFNFTTLEVMGVGNCSTTGATEHTCLSPENLTEGTHTFYASCIVGTFELNQTVIDRNPAQQWNISIHIIAPDIMIISPANNTNLTNNTLDIHYIVSDSLGLSECWYSNDTFTSNITLANCVNITDVTWSEGQHNVTIWANDTANNVNSSSVVFAIDSIFPTVNITYPINGTTYMVNVSDFNYTYSDTNTGKCWYSTTGANSTAVAAGTVFTDVTSIEETNTWSLYCNDSFGNLNTSLVTFFKDTSPPTWTIIPANASLTFNEDSLNVTFNATDFSGIGGYNVNDTTNYQMDYTTGLLINLTSQPTGTYILNISVNDTLGNVNSLFYSVSIIIFNYTVTTTTPFEFAVNGSKWSGQIDYSGNFTFNMTDYNISINNITSYDFFYNISNTGKNSINISLKQNQTKSWYNVHCFNYNITDSFQDLGTLISEEELLGNCTLDLLNVTQTFTNWVYDSSVSRDTWDFYLTFNITG